MLAPMPTFVAMRARARRLPSARPRIRSDSPPTYAFAVSKKISPRSKALWTMRCASGSGVRLPKFIVPTTNAGGTATFRGSR